jgi:hypothetical protein
VLCTGRALALPLSHPSAASPVSPPALAPPRTAWLSVLRPAGTSSWSSTRAYPSRMSRGAPPLHQHPSSGGDNSGSSVAARDQRKGHAYPQVEPNGYCFVPFSVESYGRLGLPAMKFLLELGDKAAGPGGVLRTSFVAGALREISIGLIQENFFCYWHPVACWLGPAATAYGLAWLCRLMLAWSSCAVCCGLWSRSLMQHAVMLELSSCLCWMCRGIECFGMMCVFCNDIYCASM